MVLPKTLQRPGRIAFSDMRHLMTDGDLATRAPLINFVRNEGKRIQPAPDGKWIRDELYRSDLAVCHRAALAWGEAHPRRNTP